MSALPDNAPSPWWPCPRCGEIYWRPMYMVWQRQRVNPDTGDATDPDNQNVPGSISMTNQCCGCGKCLDLSRYYGWVVVNDDGPETPLYACPDCGHFTRDHVGSCTDCPCQRSEWAEGELL